MQMRSLLCMCSFGAQIKCLFGALDVCRRMSSMTYYRNNGLLKNLICFTFGCKLWQSLDWEDGSNQFQWHIQSERKKLPRGKAGNNKKLTRNCCVDTHLNKQTHVENVRPVITASGEERQTSVLQMRNQWWQKLQTGRVDCHVFVLKCGMNNLYRHHVWLDADGKRLASDNLRSCCSLEMIDQLLAP